MKEKDLLKIIDIHDNILFFMKQIDDVEFKKINSLIEKRFKCVNGGTYGIEEDTNLYIYKNKIKLPEKTFELRGCLNPIDVIYAVEHPYLNYLKDKQYYCGILWEIKTIIINYYKQ